MNIVKQELKTSLLVLALMVLLTGFAYPIGTAVLARLAWNDQARGSLLADGRRVVGSRLIGQTFTNPKYFWGRLSATSPAPYNAAASSGSNYGPLNAGLAAAARARIEALRAADPETSGPVPVDLVTSSGSGLDPHITPEAALYQAARIARLRGISIERVQDLIRKRTEGRQLGIFGEPRVNVLLLNRELDHTR